MLQPSSTDHDLYAPSVRHALPAIIATPISFALPADESMSQRAPFVWLASMSLFVLNRVCELVHKGINFERGFKEHYMNTVSNDVLDFTRTTVSTTQIYNHLRKWRQRWIRITRLAKTKGATWCEHSSTLSMDEQTLIAYTTVRRISPSNSVLLYRLFTLEPLLTLNYLHAR